MDPENGSERMDLRLLCDFQRHALQMVHRSPIKQRIQACNWPTGGILTCPETHIGTPSTGDRRGKGERRRRRHGRSAGISLANTDTAKGSLFPGSSCVTHIRSRSAEEQSRTAPDSPDSQDTYGRCVSRGQAALASVSGPYPTAPAQPAVRSTFKAKILQESKSLLLHGSDSVRKW